MDSEIDLKQIWQTIWSKKVFILLTVVLFMVLGFVYSNFVVQPKYTAYTTLMLVQEQSADTTSLTASDITLSDKLISTYQELATSTKIVRSVLEELKINDMTEEDLKKEISVTSKADTLIIKLSITDSNPERAALIANTLADEFKKEVPVHFKLNNVSVVDRAEVDNVPSNINHTRDLVIFAIIGGVLSVAIIILINVFDDTVKESKEIENTTGLVVLAEFPSVDFSKQ